MKKSVLFIALILCCRLVIMAQEFEISATAQKYIDRAEMAMEMVKEPNDWQKVINELDRALAEEPNLPNIIPDIIYNMGICYHAMGGLDVNNYKKAIGYYEQFLTSNPSEEDREDVVNRINNANTEITVEKERKVLSYQLEMKAQEQEVSATVQKYVERAKMAMNLVEEPKDYQKVIEELKKALAETPNNPSIIFNLGICYDGMGVLDVNNYKTAIQYYRQFLSFNPNEEDRRNVNRRINKAEYAIEEFNRQKQKEVENMFGMYLGKWRSYAPSTGAYRDERDISFFMEGNQLKVKYISKYHWYCCGKGGTNIPDEYETADVFLTNNGIRFTVHSSGMQHYEDKYNEYEYYEYYYLTTTITYDFYFKNNRLEGTHTLNATFRQQKSGKKALRREETGDFRYKKLDDAIRAGNVYVHSYAYTSDSFSFVR